MEDNSTTAAVAEQAPAPGPGALVRQASRRPESKLIVAKDWHVDTVPPKSSYKGALIPAFLSHQRRRVSVEVHRFYDSPETKKKNKAEGIKGDGFYDEAFLRILEPESNKEKKLSKQLKKDVRRGVVADIPDDSSIGGGSTIAGDDQFLDVPDYEGWRPKYKLPLSAISIQSTNKRVVSIDIDYRSIKQHRKIYYDTAHEAQESVNFIRYQQAEDEKRKDQKFANNSTGVDVNPMEHLTLLVEIVGGTDLPASDLMSSDPFVICFFNHKEVHRTDVISNTLDPIWTMKNGALFLLKVKAKELFQGDGLHFDIMDHDTVGKNDRLGHTCVDPKTMFHAKGERMKLELEGKDTSGHIAIRIRHATPYDIQFITELEEKGNKKGHSGINEMLKVAHDNKGGKSALKSVLSRNERTEKHGMAPPIKKFRTRPGPDPRRPDETEWMTKDMLNKEMMEDSREWIDAGSGDLGRLFVEVLECNGLPNLDTGGMMGNKTDGFCALVYEDVWAQTDIIDDDLDPQWMPWTKRAFIFHMFHSSSELYIGAFDFDGVDDHDLIGRVAVNVSNLQPDTTYVLTYNLYRSGKHTMREPRGTITIRVRMEIDDDRKLLLSTLEPPKTIYVNVKTKKDFKVLHQVCNGDIDMESYSLKTFFTYIDELQSYQGVLLYLKEAVLSLLLWRGNHSVDLFGKHYSIPLHSMTAFIGCVLLVEYPQLMPSAFFASISWILIASMFFRRHHPNPWCRCKSFTDILVALVYGDSFPPAKITAGENDKAIVAWEEYWMKKAEDEQKRAEEAAQEAADEEEENEAAANDIGDGDNDLSTKANGKLIPISVDPLKPYMEPFQAYLAIACRLVRYVRNIFMWEECYLAFWLSFGCLILSVGCVFVPWFFLIRWTSRIVVWTVFGPWMKLVDVYYWSPMENMSEEELAEAKQKRKELRKKFLAEAIERARIERENAKKLKTMKKYMFGKFIMKVPVLKEDRWQDIPLPESTAVPYAANKLGLAELAMKEAGYRRTRIPGQQLEGDMIPSMETKNFTDAPPGQATKKHAQAESDTGAYAKVGSIVAGAAVMTYFAVPMVSSAFSSLS